MYIHTEGEFLGYIASVTEGRKRIFSRHVEGGNFRTIESSHLPEVLAHMETAVPLAFKLNRVEHEIWLSTV